MSNPNNPVLKKDRLVVEVKGMQHPILGQRITAMILTDKGFEILTDGGNVFLAVGATDVIRINGDDISAYRSSKQHK